MDIKSVIMMPLKRPLWPPKLFSGSSPPVSMSVERRMLSLPAETVTA
jgi:hypothetical protein